MYFWIVVIGLRYTDVDVEKAVEGDREVGEEARMRGSNIGSRVRVPRFKSMPHRYEQLGTIHLTSFMVLFLHQSTGKHRARKKCLRGLLHGLIRRIISDIVWWSLVT